MADGAPRQEIAPVRLLRYVRAVALRARDDDCLRHAAALTYTSLLSLVPLLALMFAVLKGLGVQRRLEPLLLSRLALDPSVTEQIISYIDHTNVRTLGALGAAALITTVISVLGSIESSFNHIWRVRQGRTWWRKATDYVSTVLLTPFLLLVAVALTSSLQEQALLHWVLQTEYIGPLTLQLLRMAPFAINAVALGMLYAIMPNRRPCAPAILVGAVLAGAGWQLVQWGYVALQIGVAGYNAIYGALAQLPVTLVWIYLSWTVVLIGAELAAVYELGADAAGTDLSTSRLAIALHVLVRAMDHFSGSGAAIEPRRLARELRLDSAAVLEITERLHAGGVLAPVEGTQSAYVLARDPEAIDLATLAALVGDGLPPNGVDARVRALFEELNATRRAALRQRTLASLRGGTNHAASQSES